jgi:hypothetical protein
MDIIKKAWKENKIFIVGRPGNIKLVTSDRKEADKVCNVLQAEYPALNYKVYNIEDLVQISWAQGYADCSSDYEELGI